MIKKVLLMGFMITLIIGCTSLKITKLGGEGTPPEQAITVDLTAMNTEQ